MQVREKNGDFSYEKGMKKLPMGRRAAKEMAMVDYVRMKKINMAKSALSIQQNHRKQITRRNEIFVFIYGPTGSGFKRP